MGYGCQQNLISPDNDLRGILEFVCSEASKLINCGVYYSRQIFFKTGKIPNCAKLHKVLGKETKQDKYSITKLIEKAFPAVPYSENRHINVKGEKSPYDGDISYWSERKSKLYDGHTSKAIKKQSHSCKACGLKFVGEEKIHLHHADGNHSNWDKKNLVAIHESCHDYIHMNNRGKIVEIHEPCQSDLHMSK